MKKKFYLFLLLLLVSTVSLVGCSPSDDPGGGGTAETPVSSGTAETPVSGTSGERDTNTVQTMSIDEFENLLATQPLFVSRTKYVVQDEQYKTLYPDMLQAILQSNTTEDIKDALVAFVAWDSNNLPVKIKGNIDFSSGSYIKEVKYSDINLVNGETYGENSGFSLDENNGIATFKAIVVSYETFDGNTWENPYYEDFCSRYEGQKLK